jgi:hypothetical protein
MRNIFSHDSKDDVLIALRGAMENNAEESMTYFNFNEGYVHQTASNASIRR